MKHAEYNFSIFCGVLLQNLGTRSSNKTLFNITAKYFYQVLFVVAVSQGKNRRIHELETTISEEHEQITSAFEKAQLVHLEQHKEMEKQIELVRPSLCASMYE